MAKLPRKTQKIFCSKPTSEKQTSVFGTMKTADKQYSTDVGTLQSNAAYEQGWKSATIASYKPFMEDFNTLNYINTSQLAYLFQQGIPEWDSATTYYKNSFCSYNGDLWQSLIDDNLGNAPFEGDEWTLFSTKNKGGGLELCDIGMALYVDETKGLRRILNGSILDITFNYKAFLTRLLKIKDTNPDYFTTEANWQAEKAMNIDGCVYKFVLNYDSTGTNVVSVRLPKYPDYIELNDLSTSPTVSVAGNGKPLRLTNGTTTGYLSGEFVNNGNNGSLYVSTAAPSLGSTASRVYVGGQVGVVTDASLSGLTGTINATTTKLKLIYFIQVATGSETENNIVNEIELNNPYSLFDSKYSDHELNNLSWLKSEGQWNAKAVYPTAYDELLREYNNPDRLATFNKDVFKVVGNPTITDDGIASGFSASNLINSTITLSQLQGKSWKLTGRMYADNTNYAPFFGFSPNKVAHSRGILVYSADSSQIQFIGMFGVSGATSQEGQGIHLKLSSTPQKYIDISLEFNYNTGVYTLTSIIDNTTIQTATYTPTTANKELYLISSAPTQVLKIGHCGHYDRNDDYANGSIDLKNFSITVDGVKVFSGAKSKVKLSTETYTDYDFVINTTDETFRLPLKTLHSDDTVDSLSLYYYVGETVQNANLIDAGRIGEELATKTDMLQASGAGMPSSRYIDLTLGASGSTYTAPANGFFNAKGKASTGSVQGQLWLTDEATSLSSQVYSTQATAVSAFIPVKKGHVVNLIYAAFTVKVLRFIYAEGSK